MTFTLTGLPATLDELDSFSKDASPVAEERVVDRLLMSRSYGEQFGRIWMDQARYADSYGRHEDTEALLWPWRDWLIDSINRNLPYDQFLTQQIAGDLLPSPSREQVIATAFNRMAQQSNESGSNEIEFRLDQVADRVRTASTAFLGLTMECAKCHDHKFDPISTKEYWQMAAFFDNIEERGVYSQYCPLAAPSPSLPLYSREQSVKEKFLLAKLENSDVKMKAVREEARMRFNEWISSNGPPHLPLHNALANWFSKTEGKYPKGAPITLGIFALGGCLSAGFFCRKPLRRVSFIVLSLAPIISWVMLLQHQRTAWDAEPLAHFVLGSNAHNEWANVTDPGKSAHLSGRSKFSFGERGRVLDLKGDDEVKFANQGDFHRHDAFSFVVWLRPEIKQERAVVIHRSMAGVDDGRGYEVLLEDGSVTFALSYFFPGNEVRVRTKQTLPLQQWTNLAVCYDGSSKANGMKLYFNGREMEIAVVSDTLTKDIDRSVKRGDTEVEEVLMELGGRRHDLSLKQCQVGDFWIFNRAISATEALALAKPETKFAPQDWFEWYLATKDESWKKALVEQKRLRALHSELLWEVPEIMVMRELKEPRPRFVRTRGDYRQPAEAVEPGTPTSVLAFAGEFPKNRLGLAQWMTDARNPLTARVAVNRIWQTFFGRGIVGTPEDFGVRGEVPTHPELLDWLAVEFRESGWDVKKLVRRIALSKTFRQSSRAVGPDRMSVDPNNRFLSRGPSVRLEAEEIRDQALATSGLLESAMGGPPTRPYLPDNLYKDSGLQQKYVQDKGNRLYRRSLYTFWRRTLPPPDLAAFDAPSRDYCVACRTTTVTPSQALVLLDSPQFVEAARVMAQNLVRKFPRGAEDDAPRVAEAFRRLTGRELSSGESKILSDMLACQRENFLKTPDEAKTFLKNSGEYGTDPTLLRLK